MTSLNEQYFQLVALTELYLFQEYSLRDWKYSEKESYDFYKNFARTTRRPQQPKQTAPPPPPMPKPSPPQNKRTQPKPAPPKKQPVPEQPKEPVLTIKPVEKFHPTDVEDFKKLFNNLLVESPSDDTEAHRISQQWKENAKKFDAIILSDREQPEHHAFLVKVAIALKNHERHAEVVDITDENISTLPSPTVVVASRHLLEKHPKLKGRFEASSHLIIISSITDILKDQKCKRELWNNLRESLGIILK